MTLAEKRQALFDELSPFEDPHERFQYIIDRASAAPGLPEEFHEPVFRIEGCVANLWVVPSFKDGLCQFDSDSDAVITKGIAMLVCEYYSGATPAEVLDNGRDFLAEAGITQHLTPNRRNGLSNLVSKIRAFAELHATGAAAAATGGTAPPAP
ncbi:MAG: SufE family protein [Puniceicoccales bacterium]|jgi:cysteine desulfuration protein SufE|nr:SufE family protein [Puniceicoccales bacterium]